MLERSRKKGNNQSQLSMNLYEFKSTNHSLLFTNIDQSQGAEQREEFGGDEEERGQGEVVAG